MKELPSIIRRKRREFSMRQNGKISLQIGLVLRLNVIVASRSRVSNIRPNGRADGHKVHPYSNPALLELLGE